MITLMVPHILETFPEARFIHIVRDGRAVALSYLKKQKKKIDDVPRFYQKNGYDAPFDDLLETFARSWKRHIEEVERQKSPVGPLDEGRLHELSYEDFCADPRAQLRRVIAFIGLDPNRLDAESLPRVRSTNYKYGEELGANQIERISEVMESVLSEKGYGEVPRQQKAS
jgi:hypothetical protein